MSRGRGILMVVSILGLAGCAVARVEGTAQPLPAGGYGQARASGLAFGVSRPALS